MACYVTKRHYVEAFRLGVDETPSWFHADEGIRIDEKFNLFQIAEVNPEDNPEKTEKKELKIGEKGDYIIKISDTNFSLLKPAEFLEGYEMMEA